MSTATLNPPIDVLPDDYEVVDGQIVELAPMAARAIEAANDIAYEINLWSRPNGIGKAHVEMLIQLDEEGNLQRRPDAMFVSAATWPFGAMAPETPAWKVIPEVAIEVVSRSNTMDTIMEKADEYFRFGVRRLWVVLPRQDRIHVYHSLDGPIEVFNRTQSLRDNELLPGFELPLAKVFRTAITQSPKP